MKRLLLIFLLLFCGQDPIHAQEFNSTISLNSPISKQKSNWTATDTALQLTFSTLLIMDWTQTLQGNVRDPKHHEENNKFLGKHPSKRDVNQYFASCILGHAIISYYLPKSYRNFWQSTSIIFEYSIVQHNRDIGLGISLHF